MGNKILILLLFASILLFIKSEDYKSFTAKLGLNLEEIEVITEDRYIITIWRLTSQDPLNRNGKYAILQLEINFPRSIK